MQDPLPTNEYGHLTTEAYVYMTKYKCMQEKVLLKYKVDQELLTKLVEHNKKYSDPFERYLNFHHFY